MLAPVTIMVPIESAPVVAIVPPTVVTISPAIIAVGVAIVAIVIIIIAAPEAEIPAVAYADLNSKTVMMIFFR